MGASRGRGRSASRQREVTNRAETIGGHATMKKTVTVIFTETTFPSAAPYWPSADSLSMSSSDVLAPFEKVW